MSNEIVVQQDSEMAVAKGTEIAQMMRFAIENDKVEALERLSMLMIQQEDRADKISFRNAMTRFKENMPTVIRQRVIKDKEGNDKYKATALEDIATPVIKSLTQLGVTYRWKTADLPDGRIRCTCILGLQGTAYEEEGSSLAAPPDTAGGKDALKAVGSTTSYLEKYTLMASIGMHVYGTDPEAVPVDGITQSEGSDHVDAIRSAETAVAVMKIWAVAIAAAQKFSPIDYKAMTVFTEARDERLRELKKTK